MLLSVPKECITAMSSSTRLFYDYYTTTVTVLTTASVIAFQQLPLLLHTLSVLRDFLEPEALPKPGLVFLAQFSFFKGPYVENLRNLWET